MLIGAMLALMMLAAIGARSLTPPGRPPCPPFAGASALLILVAALLFLAELDMWGHGSLMPHQGVLVVPFIEAIALFVLIFALAAQPQTWRAWGRVVAASLVFPLSNLVVPWACHKTIEMLPHIYDAQVVRLDETLGVLPSFLLGDFLRRHRDTTAILEQFYNAVAMPAALVATCEARQHTRDGRGALSGFFLIAVIGFGAYFLLPVVGPVPYFGRAFPLHAPQEFAPPYRNAMPSLHFAWVLMAFLSSRGMPLWVRAVTGSFVGMTGIATLGLGEHYLTDLVVAFPCVLLVRALCAIDISWRTPARRKGALGGLLMLFIWGLAVRGGVVPGAGSHWVPVAMLATVVGCLLLESRLSRRPVSIGLPDGG